MRDLVVWLKHAMYYESGHKHVFLMDIHVTIFRVEVLEAHNVHADMGSQV